MEVCCLVVGTQVLYYVFKKHIVCMRSGVEISDLDLELNSKPFYIQHIYEKK